jgi:hypothetical protein
LDNDLKPISRIYSNEIEKGVESFYSITSQSGVISEIGSLSLDETSHIYLHGVDYKIYINTDQDTFLRNHYKSTSLELKVKQRRSVKTGRIISAKLLAVRIKEDISFTDSLKRLSKDDLSFLDKINNYQDILALIRS